LINIITSTVTDIINTYMTDYFSEAAEKTGDGFFFEDEGVYCCFEDTNTTCTDFRFLDLVIN